METLYNFFWKVGRRETSKGNKNLFYNILSAQIKSDLWTVEFEHFSVDGISTSFFSFKMLK